MAFIHTKKLGSRGSTNKNPLYVDTVNKYFTIWDTETDFNKGTNSSTEVSGSGTASKVQLIGAAGLNNDVLFLSSSNYSFSTSVIAITASSAQLVPSMASENNWEMSNAANYTFSATAIEITGGAALLAQIPISTYAWYHLNQSAGAADWTTTTDESSNGYDMILSNGTTTVWTAGKLNNNVLLNGSNQYLCVATTTIADFTATASFTIECWAKTNTGTSHNLIAKRENGGFLRGYELQMNTAGGLYLVICNDNAAGRIIKQTNNNGFNNNTYHHYVWLYDGSKTATGTSLYIDNTFITCTVVDNDMTGTMQNTSKLCIGARGGASKYWDGYVDEAVVYDYELSTSQISDRYNAGAGTETMPTIYVNSNPAIYPNTGHSFTTALSVFTITATTPTSTDILFQASSDNGVTWKFWDSTGWTSASGYSEANSSSVINTNIGTLANTGTFKFNAYLHTSVGTATPELDNVYIAESTIYQTGGFSITMSYDIQPSVTIQWLSATETTTTPTNTSVKYQYSIDSGTTWSGAWLIESSLSSAITGITTAADGSDTLRMKFNLQTSISTATPEIDNLRIISDSGYTTTGEYESNEYNSTISSQEWGKIEYNVTTPTNTAIVFRAKAGNSTGVLGSYSSALTNLEETNLTGKYFQWKAEFTGTGLDTPEIDNCGVHFQTNEETEVKP